MSLNHKQLKKRNTVAAFAVAAVAIAALSFGSCATTGPQDAGQTGTQISDRVQENFDSGRLGFQLKSFQSSDGAAIVSANVSPKIETSGGVGDSGNLAMLIDGKIAQENWNESWNDSYLFYHIQLQSRTKTSDSKGLGVSLKPEGFASFEIGLLQQKPDGEHQYTTSITLPEGKWSNVRLPWSLLEGAGPSDRPDPGLASSVLIIVPWFENWAKGYFRGTEFDAKLRVDDIGTWTGALPEMLVDFEPSVYTATWDAEIYGMPITVEYDDDGNAKTYQSPGVKNMKLSIEPQVDEKLGTFLRTHLTADIDSSFKSIIDKKIGIGIGIHGRIARSFSKAAGLQFQARASESLHGGFQLTDIEDDWKSYGKDLNINKFWSQIDLPFSELSNDGTAPTKAALERERPRIDLGIDIPIEVLKRALTTGKLDIYIDLDDFAFLP